MLVWVYWIIGLSLATAISVIVVKRYSEYGFATLASFYIIYLAASQVMAARIITFDLGYAIFLAPASVFIYPFIAQVIDMINEVYGEKMTHVAILIAFVTQILLIVFIAMINSVSPAPFFAYEEAWQSIFGLSIRITVASWIAFLITANIDAYLFASLKRRFHRREQAFTRSTAINPYIWLRSSASDVANLSLDSVIFVTIAFSGVLPVLPLILGQIVSKVFIGLIDTPWFVWYKGMLKQESSGRP
jgi:queuosine precursor transporter